MKMNGLMQHVLIKKFYTGRITGNYYQFPMNLPGVVADVHVFVVSSCRYGGLWRSTVTKMLIV